MSPKGHRQVYVTTSSRNSATGSPGPSLYVYTPTTSYFSNLNDVSQLAQAKPDSMIPEFLRAGRPSDDAPTGAEKAWS